MADREPPVGRSRMRRRPVEVTSLEIVIDPPGGPGEVPGMCDRVRVEMKARNARRVVCDVRALSHPDVLAIHLLARIQLTARQLGGRVWLRDASPELRALLALTGLDDTVPCLGELSLEPERQAEEREELGGVEEEGDAADAPP